MYARSSARQVSKDDILRARENADETGRIGEELVNAHLVATAAAGGIGSVEWTAQSNAVAPYDFKIVTSEGKIILIDVKCTAGEFERPLHFSFNEILQIANGAERYEVFRVYEATMSRARLRTCEDLRQLGLDVFKVLSNLPEGVYADSMSVSPRCLKFSDESIIEIPDPDDPQGEAN